MNKSVLIGQNGLNGHSVLKHVVEAKSPDKETAYLTMREDPMILAV